VADETQEERELKKENERWKDYANALLIAMPVLLAALAISGIKTCFSLICGIAGVAGIILVILWYGRDKSYYLFIRGRKYPTFLFWASCSIGIQAVFLCFAFLIKSM